MLFSDSLTGKYSALGAVRPVNISESREKCTFRTSCQEWTNTKKYPWSICYLGILGGLSLESCITGGAVNCLGFIRCSKPILHHHFPFCSVFPGITVLYYDWPWELA